MGTLVGVRAGNEAPASARGKGIAGAAAAGRLLDEDTLALEVVDVARQAMNFAAGCAVIKGRIRRRPVYGPAQQARHGRWAMAALAQNT